MHTVKLSDGTTITAKKNGNNYIPERLEESVFTGNLERVEIIDNKGNIDILENQKVQFAKIRNQETFILAKKSQAEMQSEYLLENDFRISLLEMGVNINDL